MFRLLFHTYAQSLSWIGKAFNQLRKLFHSGLDAFKWLAFWIVCALLGALTAKIALNYLQPPAHPRPRPQGIQWPAQQNPDTLLNDHGRNDLLQEEPPDYNYDN